MPLPFLNREESKIRKIIESYRGWVVIDDNGRRLGRVESVDYRVERENGKSKVVITGLSVNNDGEVVKYLTKDYSITLDDKEKIVIVKPKGKSELEVTIDEVKARLEDTVGKLRKVNELLIKLGDAMLKIINSNEKIPQDLVDKFRKLLETERERYVKECEEIIEKLNKLMSELDVRISEMEAEYGELKLKSELTQLSGEDKVKLNELRNNLDKLRGIRNNLTMLIYKYRGECI